MTTLSHLYNDKIKTLHNVRHDGDSMVGYAVASILLRAIELGLAIR